MDKVFMNWEESVVQSIGEINPYRLDLVLRIDIEWNFDDVENRFIGNILLQIVYQSDLLLTILIEQFQQLKMPEVYGSCFQLSEFSITNIRSNQMENIKYRFNDHFDEFECLCKNAKIVQVNQYSNNRIGELVWKLESDL